MSRAQSTPSVRSLGVVATLATPICPLASSTSATPVNVPPRSTPIPQPMPRWPIWGEALLSARRSILLRDVPEFGGDLRAGREQPFAFITHILHRQTRHSHPVVASAPGVTTRVAAGKDYNDASSGA